MRGVKIARSVGPDTRIYLRGGALYGEGRAYGLALILRCVGPPPLFQVVFNAADGAPGRGPCMGDGAGGGGGAAAREIGRPAEMAWYVEFPGRRYGAVGGVASHFPPSGFSPTRVIFYA